MKQLKYKVSFTTPAFLGNAEQQAQWRTPPFKALLRQWWRVVHAPKVNYDVDDLRRDEGVLFGVAADGGDSRQSLVRLRLDTWSVGTLNSVEQGDVVEHPEVRDKQGNPRRIGANLYLGYGPIQSQSPRNAIKAETLATLQLLFPNDCTGELQAALQLAAWFGTLGSRSRNGWGALTFEGNGIQGFKEINIEAIRTVVQPIFLSDCLRRDWPHAIGQDMQSIPLVWRLLKVKTDGDKQLLDSFSTWQEVMRELARIKIRFRTHFAFQGGGYNTPHRKPQERHILSYPAGAKHQVQADEWGANGRLANQIRFKVHRRGNGYAGVIVHLPCTLPSHMACVFAPNQIPNQQMVWQEVHRLLDAERQNGLVRIKGAQA